MEQGQTDLSKFNNDWYKTGRNVWVRFAWFLFQGTLFSSWIPGSGWRRILLKLFGARIGKNVVIKPRMIVKYPWNISIGENSWIGEKVWLDSLGKIAIGPNCCISQGALLLCGNHDYKAPGFDLMVGDIALAEGVWIGARCVITAGVNCASHSVLSAGSIASKNLEAYSIYAGNPAVKVRERSIEV
jgi:putative colanic acid biosynthesis acetyltransferase WcaF